MNFIYSHFCEYINTTILLSCMSIFICIPYLFLKISSFVYALWCVINFCPFTTSNACTVEYGRTVLQNLNYFVDISLGFQSRNVGPPLQEMQNSPEIIIMCVCVCVYIYIYIIWILFYFICWSNVIDALGSRLNFTIFHSWLWNLDPSEFIYSSFQAWSNS